MAIIIVLMAIVIATIIIVASKNKEKGVPGYIEANLTYVSADGVSGPLQDLAVARGQLVRQGQLLFAINPSRYRYQNDSDQHQVTQQKANYEDLLTGKRQPYIEQVKAQIKQEQENLIYLKKSYHRAKDLLKSDSTSQEDYDLAYSQYEQSKAHLASLEYQLKIETLKAREKQIDSAQSAIKVAQSQQDLSHWQLMQTKVVSPASGRIFDTYYWPGEQVQAYHPVVSILIPKQVRLVFYIEQKRLSQIKLGQKITFKIDGSPQSYSAKISYISPQAEYTPPVIYSQNSRQDLSFKIEAKINIGSASQNWHPGQPVSVYTDA